MTRRMSVGSLKLLWHSIRASLSLRWFKEMWYKDFTHNRPTFLAGFSQSIPIYTSGNTLKELNFGGNSGCVDLHLTPAGNKQAHTISKKARMCEHSHQEKVSIGG